VRTLFPGHFRPTAEEFNALWAGCIFAVDANVLLNLYRYSQATRQELERALKTVNDRLFLPHQAAKEFLRNRLGVSVGQAEEYTKTVQTIRNLKDVLSNSKRHPFLPDAELPKFSGVADDLCKHLEAQKDALLSRLVRDEILDFVEAIFSGKTGDPFNDDALKKLAADGDTRYQSDIPPGFRDAKKDGSSDPYRKYGDLIVWKQLIRRSKDLAKDVVFITDDKKDDWWLEQSGRTIGPRPDLIEEFIRETGKKFWMYSVDKFVEEAARISNTAVNKEAIAEIIETREVAKSEAAVETQAARETYRKIVHPVLSEDELLAELRDFLSSHPSDDGSVGLRYFVVNYLGSQNYEINHSYARLNVLAEKGLVEIFKREKNGVQVMCVRLISMPATDG
jgi:PIN like domain